MCTRASVFLFVLGVFGLLVPRVHMSCCHASALTTTEEKCSGSEDPGVSAGYIVGQSIGRLAGIGQVDGLSDEESDFWAPVDRVDTEGANPGRVLASDDKRKVPKKQKSKEKKKESDEEESDDDESGNSFTDCLGDIFMSIMCSGGDDEETAGEVEAAYIEPGGYDGGSVYSVDGVDIPFMGVIAPESPTIEVVNLWTVPGGPGSDGSVVSGLARGSRVHVLGLQYADGDQPWLWVRTDGPGEVTGWVHVDYVVPEELYEPPEEAYEASEHIYQVPEELGETPEIEDTQGEPPAAGYEPGGAYGGLLHLRKPSTWEVVFQVGWTPVESQLRGEFGWSGIGGRVAARFFPVPNLLLGLEAGYAGYWGEPEFDYEIDRDGRLYQKDIPVDSDLGLLEIETQIGGRITGFGAANSPWSMLVAMEAGVSRVEQRGPIEYEIYDEGGSVTRRGRREDVLTRWRPVIGVSGELNYTCASGFVLGFHVGLKGVHWKPEEKESMNLDWLEGEFISIFYCGLNLGYAFD